MAAPKSYGESRKTGYRSAKSLTDTTAHSCDQDWGKSGNVRSTRLPGGGMHSKGNSRPKSGKGMAY